ncbi:DNA-formamidopyrimidine glycosylase family protein [Dyadobacter alkalitolerans]|uniref:DNA-formamidopyrimidine glycosylase family protein n=1 Tax=Dyadobacter alkalitolerans TaxID=492736 RepID=UPI0003F6E11A|nr:DNA-formamidopyrimidine glycosylase family protein [Dyadobacter alkalitolerans]
MPEVPELLTLRHNLLKRFKGQKLTDFNITWERKLKIPKQKIISAVEGTKLTSIERVGKTLELHFDNKETIGLHLMQSGRPYLIPADSEIKWKIWHMMFEKGLGFGIQDPSGQTQLHLNPVTPNVPDVLTDSLTFDYLKSIFQKNKHVLLKPLLTNPKYIRGLGNAYIDEILWEVKIAPTSVACLIPDQKIHDILAAINLVLISAEKEIRKVTGPDALMIEKRDFMKVHNHKLDKDPDGNEIIKGIVGKAKTYWTENQVVYELISK